MQKSRLTLTLFNQAVCVSGKNTIKGFILKNANSAIKYDTDYIINPGFVITQHSVVLKKQTH